MAGHEIGFEEPPQACRLISGLVDNNAGFVAFEVGTGSVRADPAANAESRKDFSGRGLGLRLTE